MHVCNTLAMRQTYDLLGRAPQREGTRKLAHPGQCFPPVEDGCHARDSRASTHAVSADVRPSHLLAISLGESLCLLGGQLSLSLLTRPCHGTRLRLVMQAERQHRRRQHDHPYVPASHLPQLALLTRGNTQQRMPCGKGEGSVAKRSNPKCWVVVCGKGEAGVGNGVRDRRRNPRTPAPSSASTSGPHTMKGRK
jgi:hypothetical protein